MKNNKNNGFTMIELLMVVAIAAIILSWALPGFKSANSRSQISAAAIDYVSAMNYVQAQSMRLRRPITFCKTSDGSSCNPSAEWEQGWIAFVDSDQSGMLSPGESPLKVWDGLSEGYTPGNVKHFRYMTRHSPYSLGDAQSPFVPGNGRALGAIAGDTNRMKESMNSGS